MRNLVKRNSNNLNNGNVIRKAVFSILILVVALEAYGLDSTSLGTSSEMMPWWGWSLLLFGFCFVLGIGAMIAGLGGGILYVPIVSALFPFHLDYVRGAGLLVVLSGALSAAPRLLSSGLASLRLALPMALASSLGSLIGANVGLTLSSDMVEISLGLVILAIVTLMVLAKQADYPLVPRPDPLALRLGIQGSYVDASTGEKQVWNIHRLVPGFFIFFTIGFVAGIFGLGAGWANVPAMNLLLGVPMKVSVATSILVIAINGSTASLVYLNQGAVLPVIAVPSVLGMMLGTRIGSRVLLKIRAKIVRYTVIAFLVFIGLWQISSGTGVIW